MSCLHQKGFLFFGIQIALYNTIQCTVLCHYVVRFQELPWRLMRALVAWCPRNCRLEDSNGLTVVFTNAGSSMIILNHKPCCCKQPTTAAQFPAVGRKCMYGWAGAPTCLLVWAVRDCRVLCIIMDVYVAWGLKFWDCHCGIHSYFGLPTCSPDRGLGYQMFSRPIVCSASMQSMPWKPTSYQAHPLVFLTDDPFGKRRANTYIYTIYFIDVRPLHSCILSGPFCSFTSFSSIQIK